MPNTLPLGTSIETIGTVDIELAADDNNRLQSILRDMPGLLDIHESNGNLIIQCTDEITASGVNQYCFDKGVVLNQLSLKRKSLEKRFLEITGEKSDR